MARLRDGDDDYHHCDYDTDDIMIMIIMMMTMIDPIKKKMHWGG